MHFDYGCEWAEIGGTTMFGPLGGWTVMIMGLGLLLLVGMAIWFVAWQGRQVHVGPHQQSVQTPLFPGSAPRQDTALTIVRERYARGEIDHEEYERVISGLGR